MMKLLLYLSAAILLLSSCGPSDQEKQDKADRVYVDSIVTAIDSNIYNFRYLGVGAYYIDGIRHTLTVAYSNGRPVLITNVSDKYPLHSFSFYLSPQNSQVIQIRDISIGEKKRQYKETVYYFNNNRFIGAKVSDEDAHTRANSYKKPWKEYKPEGSDFDTTYVNAKATANQMIATVQAERPSLSHEANDARKRGAIYWATGSNPDWTLSVTPYTQLTFETNHGTERYIFHTLTVSGLKGETETSSGTLYKAQQNGKTIEARFINNPHTDKWGIEYPCTVYITFGGLEYQGCGMTL